MKHNILIVEDESIIAMHLEALLLGFGYDVVGVTGNGEEALAMYESLRPDIMFVDIVIDGPLSGVDVVEEIKRNHHDVPVIYVTSNTDPTTLQKAKDTLPSAFIKKPFEELQLKTTLEVAINRFVKEKALLEKIEYKNKMQEQSILELSTTNQHLVTATWRERELKKQLQKSKEIIERQNKSIVDSINYATRIQSAIIPDADRFAEVWEQHFMIYKPKNIISGDFPWIFSKGDYTYFAVVDCTGHGVPGAMMSLIGFLLFNDIVNNKDQIKAPSEMLNELHSAVVRTLKQDTSSNKNRTTDGMDVVLCRYNKETSELLFAGAHLPLYHLSDANGQVTQYKGDSFPIGGMQYGGHNAFTDKRIEIKKGDTLFLLSDGFQDQFGGLDAEDENGKKFGRQRLRSLIGQTWGLDMAQASQHFESSFEHWRGERKQVDDIIVLGVKF